MIGPVRQQRSGSVSYGPSAYVMDWADRQYRTGSYGLGRDAVRCGSIGMYGMV